MATEEAKLANRARLWGLATLGMTYGVWELIQESSTALSPAIGESIVKEMEKALGLEIAGEKPEHILIELGRIFVDEYGFATEAKVEQTDKGFRVTLVNAVGTPEFSAIKESGVEKLFSHPFYCAGLAVLARLGVKARGDVLIDKTAKCHVITYELV